MHASIAPLFDRLEAQKADLFERFAAYSPAQLDFKPGDDGWSLLQVGQHLLLAESGSVHALSKNLPKSSGRTGLMTKLKCLLLKGLMRSKIKVKAPTARVIPTEEMSLDRLETSWGDLRKELGGLLANLGAEEIARPAMRHPIAGPLNLVQGMTFLNDHFSHHLHQIERIVSSPRFPARGQVLLPPGGGPEPAGGPGPLS